MDRALKDVIANPDFANAVMGRIHFLFEAIVRNSIEAAGDQFDFVYVAEDLGTQESLLMSPRAIRRFILPWLAEMAAVAHAAGKRVFHHDDGAIRPMLPDLLGIGIDILNPIQWRSKGMEREALARDFGRAGVPRRCRQPADAPVRQPGRRAPRGTENIRIFRQCRGYVIAPCHNLQSNTPTENVVALYEAVEEFGRC